MTKQHRAQERVQSMADDSPLQWLRVSGMDQEPCASAKRVPSVVAGVGPSGGTVPQSLSTASA